MKISNTQIVFGLDVRRLVQLTNEKAIAGLTDILS